VHQETVLAQGLYVGGIEYYPSATGNHDVIPCRALPHCNRFQSAEEAFAAAREYLADGLPGAPLDKLVGVHERPPQSSGQEAPNSCLA